MKMLRSWGVLLFSIAVLAVSGCSEDQSFSGSTSVAAGGEGLTVKASTLVTSIPVGSQAIINATVTQDGVPVEGQAVQFVADNGAKFGTSIVATAVTNADGLAIAVLTAPIKVGSGTVTVQAGDATDTLNFDYYVGPVASIFVEATPLTLAPATQSTLTAKVIDAYGNPIPDEALQFQVAGASGGSMYLGDLHTTDNNGIATATYTAGDYPGTDTITVVPLTDVLAPPGTGVSGSVTLTVSLTAAVIQSVTLATAPADVMTVNTTQSFTATVINDDGTGAQGLDVVFQLDGPGLLNGTGKLVTAGPTDVDGNITVTLTAPLLVNTATVSASIAGLSDSIDMTYVPDVPDEVTISASPATVGAVGDSTLIATVYDQYGNLIPDEAVVFSIATAASNDGTTAPKLTPSTGNAVTNANGVANILYTAGAKTAVSDVLSVTVTRGSITPTLDASIYVSAVTANIQSIELLPASLSNNLTVGGTVNMDATVLDDTGNTVPDGTVVAFELTGTGTLDNGSVTGKSMTASTVSGVATVALDAPLLVGSGTVTATIAGLDSSQVMTYVPDVPATVTISASPATVGAVSDSTLTATVYDGKGNVIPDEPVVFSIKTANSNDGTTAPFLTPSTGNAVTNANGVATILYTSGAKTAVSDVLSVTVTRGSIVPALDASIYVSAVTANIQSIELIPASLSNNLVVGNSVDMQATVLDDTGNTVPDGTLVAFELTGTGTLDNGSVTGKSMTASTVSGVATVALDAPLLVGSGTVTARVAGLSSSQVMTYVPDVPATVTISASPATVGAVGDSTLTATVYDGKGNVIPDEPVVFSIKTGASDDGTTAPKLTPSTGNAITNANGVATILYTAGAKTGVSDVLSVTVTRGSVVPTLDASIYVSAVTANIQSIELLPASLSNNLVVGNSVDMQATVLDDTGNTVPDGTVVAFELTGTGTLDNGSVTGKSMTAQTVSGVATVALDAPLLVGSATVTATIAGLSSSQVMTYVPDVPATVTISASPATVGVVSDSTLTATVYDGKGNVIPDEPVVFSIKTGDSGDGTTDPFLTPSTGNAVTNANGVATILYTSGVLSAQTDVLSVTVTRGTITPTLDASIYVSTATADIQSIELLPASLSNNLVVGGTVNMQAEVLDDTGNTVPDGTLVAFELVGTGTLDNGTTGVKSLTVATVSGVATVPLDAPLLVGSGTVTATIAGLSSSQTMSYVPDVPATVTLTATPAAVGISSDSTLTATLFDKYGNLTPDQPVAFTVATDVTGPTFSNITGLAQTNANGVATIVYTSGTTATGTDVIKAEASNGSGSPLPSDTVDIVVSAGATSVASLDMTLSSPSSSITVGDSTVVVSATLLDSDGAPVEAAPVAFEILGDGDFSGVKTAEVDTNAAGVASITITAPYLVGSATIKASASGLTGSLLVTYIPDVPKTVMIDSNVSSVDVSSDVTVTATVYDQYGNVTPNEPVVYEILPNNSGATLSNPAGNSQTDVDGVATITYTSGTVAGVTDTVTVDVTNGVNPTDSLNINVVSGAAPVPTKLVITTDATSIQSDGSDSATITVTVLDSANVVVPTVDVSFASTGGALSAGTVTTDASGQAVVTLNAGADPTNQTITVTATADTLSNSIQVEVVGSTVSISSSLPTLILATADETATLTITAADAAGNGVSNQTVTLTKDLSAGYVDATLSAPDCTTNALGQCTVDITGTTTGTVHIVASALGTSGSIELNVTTATGALVITSPADGSTAEISPAPGTLFSIDVPTGTTSVTLVSSLGTWASSGSNVAVFGALTPPTTITDTLSSALIGTASISAYDTNNTAIADNMQLIFVNKTVDSSSVVSLQAAPTTVAPTMGTTQNSSELTAAVTDSSGGPIAGARVTFSISAGTGSGEYVDPPVAYTDAYGKATAMFYSGSTSTDSNGLYVTATLDPNLTTPATVSDTVNIIVGGTAGSIAIGMATTVTSVNSNTAYKLPVSLQVTDSAGNPVANTEVSLSLWPIEYGLGSWNCDTLFLDTILENEDLNKNLLLDTGEDISGDGTLTPPLSAAGSIPSSVTTDESGLATFDLVYLKDYGGFLHDALTATALVQGTETRATQRFWLDVLKSDASSCVLGGSPLNSHWPTLIMMPELNPLPPTTPDTVVGVYLKDSNGAGIVGATVSAQFLSWGTDGGVAPTITSATGGVTGTGGYVAFTYTKGDKAGEDLIKFTYTTPLPNSITIAGYLVMVAE